MRFITIPGRQTQENDTAPCEHDAVRRPYIRNLFHTFPLSSLRRNGLGRRRTTFFLFEILD